jgi:hypothetical protein
VAQLRSFGFARSTAAARASVGRLFRVHRGVYALGRPDLTARGRWMAAVLACGPGAVLSHVAAAALHGIRASAASRIDVSIMRPSSVARPGIRVHRSTCLKLADVIQVDAIPVTSVARTLLDLAAVLTESQLERACDQAVLQDQFDMRAMSGLLSRSHGQRGVRKLRVVLTRGDLGLDVPASGLERRFRDLCEHAGVPAPEINRYLLLGDGYHKVDFLWRRERAVIEVDGARYHSTGWQRSRDAERDGLLHAHGYRIARVSEQEITRRPERAIEAAVDLIQEGRLAA